MSTSQLKLALTRDPRASGVVSPVIKIVPKPEAKNVSKVVSKPRTPRTSSCSSSRQAVLKIVPAIIKMAPDVLHASKDSVLRQQPAENQNTKKKRCASSLDSTDSSPPLLTSFQSRLPTSQPSLPTSSPLLPPPTSSKPPLASSKSLFTSTLSSTCQPPPTSSPAPVIKSSPPALIMHPDSSKPSINHKEDTPSLPLSRSSPAVLSTTNLAPVQAVESADEQLLVPQPKKARRQSLAVLPVSRVRTIMKAKLQPSKTGQQLGKDSVPIITKAAELFIAVLVQGAEKCEDVSGGNGEVTYKHLATSVNRQSKLQFLHEILPKKVVAKDYLPPQ